MRCGRAPLLLSLLFLPPRCPYSRRAINCVSADRAGWAWALPAGRKTHQAKQPGKVHLPELWTRSKTPKQSWWLMCAAKNGRWYWAHPAPLVLPSIQAVLPQRADGGIRHTRTHQRYSRVTQCTQSFVNLLTIRKELIRSWKNLCSAGVCSNQLVHGG